VSLCRVSGNSLSFFIGLFLAYGTSYAQMKRAPVWVINLPVTDDTFYGLGISETRDNPQFRTKARKMALRDISEKIYVSINSASELTLKYENDQMEYLLDETVAMESTNFLSGHQKVDDWTDQRAKKYYVLYKLDRLTYLENRRVYFQGVEDIIRLKRTEADQLFDSGELVRGINKLTDGLVLLNEEMDKLVEPEFYVSLQKLYLHTRYELERQLSRIDMRIQKTYDFQADDPKPLVISGFVTDRITGRPVENLKTSMEVLKGDVFHYAFNRQNTELAIHGFFPADQTATIQITVEIPLPKEVRALIDRAVRNQFTSRPITLQFTPYQVIYEPSEKGSGDQLLVRFLQSITKDLGITEEEKNALYRIRVNPRKDIIGRQRGLYTASYEAEIVVTRTDDNVEVYRFTFPARQGQGSKRHEAITAAYQRTVNDNDDFLSSFVTFLCTKPMY